MKKLFYLAIPLFIFMYASCSELSPFPSDTDIEDMNIEEVAILIDNYVGNANAEQLSQCDIVPIGAKPCGGPWGYLVFSTQNSNKSVLINYANRYTELDSIRNIEEDRGSTCDITPVPDLTLQNGACRGSRGAWNPGDILSFNGINND